nr:hypothetical protein [Tanacetum cinerariifolium]
DDHIFTTIKLVSRHQNAQQFCALLPIELTNEDIRNSNAYKEYYAIATGATPPKPKASVWKTRSSSDTKITPPTATAGPRLTTSEKGKQAAKASKSKSLSALSEVAKIEAQQLKLATKRSLQQTHISQASGFGADEGTGSIPGVPDIPTDESEEEISLNSTNEEGDDDEGKDGDGGDNDDGDDEKGDDDDEQASDEEEFIHPSLSTHTEEELRDEESFVPIPKTPKDTDDEGNGEENLGLNVGWEEGHDEEEEEDELYRDVNINQGRGIQTTQEFKDSHVTVTPFNRLRDEAQEENYEFLKTIDENMQKIIKEHVKEQLKVQVSKILPKIEQTVNEQLEAEVLTRSSNLSNTSYVVDADLSEIELKKILIEKMEGNNSIQRSNEQRNLYKALVEAYESDKIILYIYRDTVTLKRPRNDDADKDEEPSAGSDRGSKRRRKGKEPESVSAPKEKATRSTGKSTEGSKSRQTSASESATVEEPMQTNFEIEEPSHLEFETGADDQPIVQSSQHPEWFSQQKKPPTPYRDWNKTLPTTHKSIQPWISELAKQSDSRFFFNELMDTPVNPEGQQYPHNLLKPLPLIPNSQGLRVIPFDHFINNDFEYLRGGASSRKYTTSVTKTKAADYGHIKWIEDLFYRFAVNRESTRDVYSKRRIIVVTELKVVEWHNYKHLDWITMRRDDDKLYKFKEGDFKSLRIQDIDDMLLLLVQGKLTNLTVEECFAFFSVSLRMFTRRIVIQRRVEDLQIGVESYQKKLNLTMPDTYQQVERIDELHKFNDGTLTDVRTTLDDRLKGIRMKYLPQPIWRKSDKDRAAAMIQAIDKRLKTRRIMRSLERFVRGRLYEGDFRMLQRTI